MAGSKRKSNNPPDFKKLKAKVGKKALKALNDTDVSFQAASLHVAGQSLHEIENKDVDNKLVLSSRGKSLSELTPQLTHPAAPARISGLKGLNDIVRIHASDRLLPNLSLLIPACVHSCVDEDEDVRKYGIDLLAALVSKLEEFRLQPFARLITARVSSALNSLDPPTRMDGVKMAKLICSSCPSITTPYASQLYAPYIGLLSDQSTRRCTDEILQSLVSLLKVSMRHGRDIDATNFVNDDSYDLFYVPGGRSRNAALFPGRCNQSHVLPEISSINYLPSLTQEEANLNSVNIGSESKTMTKLLSKLCDCLVETTNVEYEHNTAETTKVVAKSVGGSKATGMDSVRIILLLRAIRLIRYNHENSMKELAETDVAFEKLCNRIIKLMMDTFPVVKEEDGSSEREEDINVAIAITFIDMVCNSQGDCRHLFSSNDVLSNWMSSICSYVLSRLEQMKEPGTASPQDLDVTCKLLRQLDQLDRFSSELESTLLLLYERIFQSRDIRAIRSDAGRRIYVLVMGLLEDSIPYTMSNVSMQYATVSLSCLQAWAGDFLYESKYVLQTLLSLVRRIGDTGSDSLLIKSLRDNFNRLLSPVDKKRSTTSILEKYPLALQRISLGLMVMLKSPTSETLKSLASICCCSVVLDRDSVKESLAETIVQSVHCIRTTISMQSYLTFLINSIGMSIRVKCLINALSVGEETALESVATTLTKAVDSLDCSLTRTSRLMLCAGPSTVKVLFMILPQMSSWQATAAKKEENPRGSILRTHASLIMLAFFSLSMKQQDKYASIFTVSPDAMSLQSLVDVVCKYLDRIVGDEAAMKVSLKLTSPIVGLIVSEESVLESILERVADWFVVGGLEKANQSRILSILLDWLKDSRLKPVLTDNVAGRLLKQVHRISQVKDSSGHEPTTNFVGQLSAFLEVAQTIQL